MGTLASGSRLPVTDANGNVTYTTMNDINTYVINNALATYKLTGFNPSAYSNDTDFYKGLVARAFAIKDYRVIEGEIVWNNHWYGFVRVFATTATNGVVEVIDYTNTKQFTVQVRASGVDIYEVATTNALNNKLSNIPKAGSSLTDCDNAPIGFACNNNVAHTPNGTTGHVYILTLNFDNNPLYQYQMCFQISNNNIFTRVKINGTWGNWASK